MTVPLYAGPRHVRLALVNAIAAHLQDYLSVWGDEFTPLAPPEPTEFAGPWDAFPEDGAVYYRERLPNEDPRPVPSVQIEAPTSVRSELSDCEADWYEHTFGVRARVGRQDGDYPAPIASAALHGAAEALSQAAATAAAYWVCYTARALDPVYAFGIVTAEVVEQPAFADDGEAPVGTVDYVARVMVRQRAFAPSSVRAIPSPPPPPLDP